MKGYETTRRALLKTAGAAAAASAPLTGALAADNAGGRAKLELKVAGYDYDRVRAIMDGRAGVEGADVSFHYEDIYAVNSIAFGDEKTYEVSELGLIPYVNRYINQGFRGYVLIPVFISRVFRHRNVFVHVDSGIEKPEDLKGKRVGTPGYGMSAMTWIRGFLKDQYGVEAGDMRWIETTKSSDDGSLGGSGWAAFGPNGEPRYFLPPDFPLELGPPGVDESELLLNGGCDALITAITPKAFLEENPKIRRLFTDVKQAEQDYYRNTGVFPIMHVVGIRADTAKAHPWLPRAVYDMYNEAKLKAYSDLETTTSLKVTLPWVTQEFEQTRALMGDDYWPYGIEANQKELELVMRYCHEQGLTKNLGNYRDMFHPSLLDT